MGTKNATTTEYRYYQVETPSVFREIRLPEDEESWSAAARKRYAALERLAEKHGTCIQSSSYERG